MPVKATFGTALRNKTGSLFPSKKIFISQQITTNGNKDVKAFIH